VKKFKPEYSVWREFVQRGGALRVQFTARGLAEGEELVAFVFPARPHSITVTGEEIRGVVVEEADGGYAYIVKRWRGDRGRIKLRLAFKGRYLGEVFDGEVYRVRVDWSGRHQHVLLFHGSYSPRSVRPRGYRAGRERGRLAVSWLWDRGYRGELYVRLASASHRA